MTENEVMSGELRIRGRDDGVHVTDVSFPNRTIELVVAPYDSPTEVFQPYGRVVTESIARGAFDGIETRPGRVRVNRDHDARRTVGKVLSFHPSRTEGLVAEIRVANTDLGTETLELAAEDCLDASAAFRPRKGGEQWQGRSRVRITDAWLGHIAMTPDPAYVDARVLAVRQGGPQAPTEDVSATPNLDQVRAWLLSDSLAVRYPRA